MNQKHYCGFMVTQRHDPNAVRFFVFAALPRDIMQWAVVDRAEEQTGSVQRRISQARLRSLTRFFTQDTRNVIPNSIVLAFPPGTTTFSRIELDHSNMNDCQSDTAIQWGVLSFSFDPNEPPSKRPAFIVDGQHRLFSIAEVEDERIPVLVSALLDAETNEQAFHFVVINNKVSSVPSDLVHSLLVNLDEDALQKRLKTIRVSLQPQTLLVIVDDDTESPFYHMINWERRHGEGFPAINPTAIEDSLKYIRRRFLQLDEEQDALIDFFFAMWQGVKIAYPTLWQTTHNRLFENAGFKSFSEYLCDQIETLSSMDIDFVDIEDKESISNASRQIASQIALDFWLEDWVLTGLDTSSGREMIKEDLKTIRKNRKEHKHWSDGLTLVGFQAEARDMLFLNYSK